MKKFLDPLNLESITVHLVTLFDVFLVYETKFIVTAGKMGGGIRHLGQVGGIPKQCRIKTKWALAHRRN